MPNLGRETFQSGTTRNCNGDFYGIRVTMPASGTADSITARMVVSGGHSVRAVIYTESGDLVALSNARTDVADDWNTFTFPSTVNLSAGVYTIAVAGRSTDSAQIRLFAFAAGGYRTTGFPLFTDPASAPSTATFSTDGDRDYAIYLTYTEAATGPTPPFTSVTVAG